MYEISVHSKFCRVGFYHCFGVDSVGSSGILWVGWKSHVSRSYIASSPRLIFTKISDELSFFSWFCGFIYGHPVLEHRATVWSFNSNQISGLFAPIGDFNQVFSFRDKWGKTVLVVMNSNTS